MAQNEISQNSMRVARNTMFLWFRMLVLLFIGLFTSRIILKALGIEDIGVNNAVGGVVTLFSLFTNSIAEAIGRFMTYSLGKGDAARLRKVFSTSLAIQLFMTMALVLFIETIGLWFLCNKMDIPDGRMGAAFWVLQCSLATMAIQLFSVPFNALIIAHEKMGAYAYISIVEGLLKLTVALLLFIAPGDKLIGYAVLMMVAAILVRITYTLYCRKHFPESHTGLRLHKDLLKDMGGFAGWSFFGSSALVVNTQGINLLSNVFFGVVVNAARGYATQIEGMIKPFVRGFITAINPQITKSYAKGDTEYAFELVEKGSRLVLLMLLAISIPLIFEMPILINLWLGQVPEHLVTFARLLLLLNLAFCLQPLQTLQQATGKVRRYFVTVGIISYLTLPVTWILFHFGAPAYVAYLVYIVVELIAGAAKLSIITNQIGFPAARYLLSSIVRPLVVGTVAALVTWAAWRSMDEGWLRLFVTVLLSTSVMGVGTWLFASTEGERAFIIRELKRFFVFLHP